MTHQIRAMTNWRLMLFVSAALALLVVPAAANTATDDDAYSWHAELKEIDHGNQTLTLMSRILGYAETDALESFAVGDQIALTWSGFNDSATGIRSLDPDTGDYSRPFTMPVEFVSTEQEARYLVYRVPVPADAIAAISELEPGQWVTLTSVQNPTEPSDSVIAVRPYNS